MFTNVAYSMEASSLRCVVEGSYLPLFSFAGLVVFLPRHLVQSTLPVYFLPLRPKYLPQHSVLKEPQPLLHPQYDRPRFTKELAKWNMDLIVLFTTL